MAILALLYPCIPLCLVLRSSAVNFEHTHITIDSSKLLRVMVPILHVAVSTRWNPVVSLLRRLAPVHRCGFGFIQTTVDGSIIHCPFIVIDTHVTESASSWLPCLSRTEYVPCMAAIAPVFYNGVALSAKTATFSAVFSPSPVLCSLFWMTLTTILICWHKKLLVVVAMAYIATNYALNCFTIFSFYTNTSS